jgi:hypothetical protein
MDTGNLVFIAFIVLFPIISITIYQHIQHRKEEFVNEYQRRFVDPHYYRGREAGISDERLSELWYQSLHSGVDPTIVGGAPGSIFASLIDYEIEMTSDKSPSVE